MKDNRLFLWLLFFAITGYLLHVLKPIIIPFLLSALLAYLGDPLVDRLENWKISRTLAVVVVFFSFFFLLISIVVFLIPAIGHQIDKMTTHLPDYGEWFKAKVLPTLGKTFNFNAKDFNVENLVNTIKEHIGSSSQMLKDILEKITGSANYLISFTTSLFLIPVITFYLLRDWDKLMSKIQELIPRSYLPVIQLLASRSDDVLGGFLRGQMMVMLGLGILYSVGLTILGLDLAIVIGMFAGLVSFVPYLGLIIGILFAGMMALIQFQDIAHPVGVVIIFLIAQGIEGSILTPRFVGDRIGLHPAAVLFSVLAGGQLFGFLGILLALPVAAVINVFLGYFKEYYLKTDTYLDTDDHGHKLPTERYIKF